MKENIKKLWKYINDTFDQEELCDAFAEFQFDEKQVDDAVMEYMSDAELRTLFFDIGYMALHGLFYGDIEEYNDALVEDLHFDEETVDFLNC